MNVIFKNGEKLHVKHRNNQAKALAAIEEFCKPNLSFYQKSCMSGILNFNEGSDMIFGDDFRIQIVPKNVAGDCVLVIQDYNENQEFESEISVAFEKSELAQFITLLQTAHDNL